METELYFTLFLAVLNLDTGGLQAVQAGHPPAVILGIDDEVQILGDGGMPIGLIDVAQFETMTYRLTSGDRLLLLSDGLSECENAAGTMLEAEGVAEMAVSQNKHCAADLPKIILDQVIEYAGKSNFDDDVSMLALDFGRES